jgi:hypothetical protein
MPYQELIYFTAKVMQSRSIKTGKKKSKAIPVTGHGNL